MSEWSWESRVELGESGTIANPEADRLDKIETTLAKIAAILSEAGFTEVTND